MTTPWNGAKWEGREGRGDIVKGSRQGGLREEKMKGGNAHVSVRWDGAGNIGGRG